MIWPENISAGDAFFKIIGFVYDTLQKFGDVMLRFEIFPGVSFLGFCLVVTIFGILLGFFMDNLRSDAIAHADFFEKKQPSREEYLKENKKK